jgi:hypothetical protein
LVVQLFKLVEPCLIIFLENGALVAGHRASQPFLNTLVHILVSLGHVSTATQPDQLLGQHVIIDPGTANQGAVVNPGNTVRAHNVLAGLNRQ